MKKASMILALFLFFLFFLPHTSLYVVIPKKQVHAVEVIYGDFVVEGSVTKSNVHMYIYGDIIIEEGSELYIVNSIIDFNGTGQHVIEVKRNANFTAVSSVIRSNESLVGILYYSSSTGIISHSNISGLGTIYHFPYIVRGVTINSSNVEVIDSRLESRDDIVLSILADNVVLNNTIVEGESMVIGDYVKDIIVSNSYISLTSGFLLMNSEVNITNSRIVLDKQGLKLEESKLAIINSSIVVNSDPSEGVYAILLEGSSLLVIRDSSVVGSSIDFVDSSPRIIYENVTVNDGPLDIVSIQNTSEQISGDYGELIVNCCVSLSNNTTIAHLEISNMRTSGLIFLNFTAVNYSIQIRNLSISLSYTGIHFVDGLVGELTLDNVSIDHTYTGIVGIFGNTIMENYDLRIKGIYCNRVRRILDIKNREFLTLEMSDIIAKDSGMITLTDNSMSDNITSWQLASIRFEGDIDTGVVLDSCKNVIMDNITMVGNGQGTGLYIQGFTENLTLTNSYFEAFDCGIYVGIGSENIFITRNIFVNNTYVLKLLSNVAFWLNDIIGESSVYASEDLTVYLDNGTIGNYWSAYKGTDSDLDGIMDTPYNLSPNAVDRYPLSRSIFYDTSPPIISSVDYRENISYGENISIKVSVSDDHKIREVLVVFSANETEIVLLAKSVAENIYTLEINSSKLMEELGCNTSIVDVRILVIDIGNNMAEWKGKINIVYPQEEETIRQETQQPGGVSLLVVVIAGIAAAGGALAFFIIRSKKRVQETAKIEGEKSEEVASSEQQKSNAKSTDNQ